MIKTITKYHFFFFAVFPVLFLYEHNKDLAHASYIIKPLLFSLFLAALIFSLSRLIIKQANRAAVAASLFLLLFFSFGHFTKTVPSCLDFGGQIIYGTDNYIIAFLWVLIFIFLFLLIKDSRSGFIILNKYLAAVSVALVIIPFFGIGAHAWQKKNTAPLPPSNSDRDALIKKPGNLPDIYYLVFDGYGRADVLKDLYGFDNRPFINYLENKGFYVAEKSRANYPQTYLSMASALNMTYLDKTAAAAGLDSDDRTVLGMMLKDNEVYRRLKPLGYNFVSFPLTWSGTDKNMAADITIRPSGIAINEFEELFFDTTPLRIMRDVDVRLRTQRKKILFTFERLPDITAYDKATFSYVHFLVPHPPFIFNAVGEGVDPPYSYSALDGDHYLGVIPGREKYRREYAEQLSYLNSRIESLIDEIIRRSPEAPVIILQADHGPGSLTYWDNPEKTDMRERFSILNAYYAPESVKSSLYQTITPVNTFRVLFNGLFGDEQEILPDKSYFATWKSPYRFIDVTEQLDSADYRLP